MIMTVNEDQTTREPVSDEGAFDGLQVLPVDGSELAYEVRGDGPPVLLINGSACQIETLSHVQEGLATTHRVIAYDRRGLGRSPNPTPDIRVHARDAAALIEHVAGKPAIVAGWSGGANIALQLIHDRPELVKAAVLIESGFHGSSHPIENAAFLRAILAVWGRWLRGRNRAALEMFFRFVLSRQSGGSGWDELDESMRGLFLGNEPGFRGEYMVAPHRLNVDLGHISEKEVAGWSVPMTYLLGEDSHPYFHNTHGYLANAAPKMRTIKVPGACHLMPIQQPEVVLDAVRSAEHGIATSHSTPT
jgi:pimeloyl-ACP methyl ester carboxylesterase